jgi:hypothetical protein
MVELGADEVLKIFSGCFESPLISVSRFDWYLSEAVDGVATAFGLWSNSLIFSTMKTSSRGAGGLGLSYREAVTVSWAFSLASL